jgi:hypothetical protein
MLQKYSVGLQGLINHKGFKTVSKVPLLTTGLALQCYQGDTKSNFKLLQCLNEKDCCYHQETSKNIFLIQYCTLLAYHEQPTD